MDVAVQCQFYKVTHVYHVIINTPTMIRLAFCKTILLDLYNTSIILCMQVQSS